MEIKIKRTEKRSDRHYNEMYVDPQHLAFFLARGLERC